MIPPAIEALPGVLEGMKRSSIFAATVLSLLAIPSPFTSAQEVKTGHTVSTGTVLEVNAEAGTMTIHSMEAQRPILFYGLAAAKVETAAGQPSTFSSIRPEMPVTVYYTVQDGRWMIKKLAVQQAPTAPPVAEAPVAPARPLTGAEEKALRSKAANDGDITTNPGVKARIDNDITTQPGKKDPADPDITKKAD